MLKHLFPNNLERFAPVLSPEKTKKACIILHVARKNISKAAPIGVEYMLYDWVKDYRQKCFLEYGLSLIGLAFFLSIFSRIRKHPNA